jgi:hypothetical protein
VRARRSALKGLGKRGMEKKRHAESDGVAPCALDGNRAKKRAAHVPACVSVRRRSARFPGRRNLFSRGELSPRAPRKLGGSAAKIRGDEKAQSKEARRDWRRQTPDKTCVARTVPAVCGGVGRAQLSPTGHSTKGCGGTARRNAARWWSPRSTIRVLLRVSAPSSIVGPELRRRSRSAEPPNRPPVSTCRLQALLCAIARLGALDGACCHSPVVLAPSPIHAIAAGGCAADVVAFAF